MGKIRIYSLARELRLDNNQVLELARGLGADVSTASSAIDDEIAARIRAQKTDHKGRDRAQPGQARQPRQPREQGQPRQQRQHRAQPANKATAVAPPPEAVDSEPATTDRAPAKPETGAQPTRRSAHTTKTAVPTPAAEATAHATAGRQPKRYYLIDGLNVCNWQKTPSLAPLVTLVIELKRQGHSFLCIFDANTRFVLEDLGERDKYEHLLNKFDCFGEVPGGTQADDFLLFRAHKTGDAIISNDQYRDQKYRDRYKWLRSVSPRLCKGIVLGGFLILPELDVHARVRDSLASIIKEFEEVFGSGTHRERADQRHDSRTPQRNAPRSEPKPAETRQKVEPKHEDKPAPRSAEIVPAPDAAATAAPVEGAEQRPRSRRGRRRRGRRGGGGGAAAGTTNGGGGEAAGGGGAGPSQ